MSGFAVVGSSLRRLLPPTRYRHPRDLLGLIAAGILLAAAVGAVAVAPRALLGVDAAVVSVLRSGSAGRALVGLVQVAVCAGGAALVISAVSRGQFRRLAGLAVAGLSAAGVVAGIMLLGGSHPDVLAAGLARSGWVTSAAFPQPAVLAAAAAVCIAAVPWLAPSWRRAAWIALLAAAAARLLSATVLPMELVIAAGAGALAGFAVRLATGVPDRRIGPAGVAAALHSAGLPVRDVRPAEVPAKGSRPYLAVGEDGRRLFIKALGAEQRDADLLYRAYRAIRLRHVGDARPAASLLHAVEHQALISVLAERAGVSAAPVQRIVESADGTVLLVMDQVCGRSLDAAPADRRTDDLLGRLWAQVAILHDARLAHRSLRAANVMVDADGQPWLVDFSFAEHSATRRQRDLDVAELLASLATLVGPDRAVSGAVAGLGADRVAAAVPLLQPMALSVSTRRAVAQDKGLLTRTREVAAAAAGGDDTGLAKIQRVRPRTLLMIAVAAAAFYILLPQLAQAAGSWRTLLHADWPWIPAVIAASMLTYVASAIALAGCVPIHVRFWPMVATQFASSFINRISPANIGGMALNARFLQKQGVDPATGVAAVAVNAFAGAVVHLILIVIFFVLAGRRIAQALPLPSGSTLLLILAVIAAVLGLIFATRPGRRFAVRKLVPALRSSLFSLGQVGRRPMKLAMVFGGSALITLAYIAGLVAAIYAFRGTAPFATIAAVYLGASAIAAASGSPGGLGAFEAALIAGLIAIGIRPAAAVAAVITYRLSTYWLPVAPGWAALQLLQRRAWV